MGADIEIGQGRGSNAATSPILDERPTRDESGLIGKRQPPESFRTKMEIKLPHRRKTRCDLGLDDRVDRHIVTIRSVAEGPLRPFPPYRILRQDIDNDIGVDEDHRRMP